MEQPAVHSRLHLTKQPAVSIKTESCHIYTTAACGLIDNVVVIRVYARVHKWEVLVIHTRSHGKISHAP